MPSKVRKAVFISEIGGNTIHLLISIGHLTKPGNMDIDVWRQAR